MMHEMTLNMRDVLVRKMQNADLPRILQLLADDELGQLRETLETTPHDYYRRAFTAIDADSNQYLAVFEKDDNIIGCLLKHSDAFFFAKRMLGWAWQYHSSSNGNAPYLSVFQPPLREELDLMDFALLRDRALPVERNDVVDLRELLEDIDTLSAMSS